MERDVAYKEGLKRGWFSYTDLNFLMDSAQLAAVVQAVVSVSSIFLATYAAGVATLLGSALVASHLPGTSLAPRHSPAPSTDTSRLVPPADELMSNDTEVIETQVLLATMSCNRSYPSDDEIGNRNRKHQGAGWEWWLSSLMTWLPEYSGLKSKLSPITEYDMQDRTRTLVTNARSVFDIGGRARNDRREVTEINWKETLSLDLELPMQDWRRYAGYIAKISLGHRH